jgi:hypothetical protein
MQQPHDILAVLRHGLIVCFHPGVATFRRIAPRGHRVDAALFIAIATCIPGIFKILFSPSLLFLPLITHILFNLIGFFFLVAIIHAVGTHRGGFGNFDEISYLMALFHAPFLMVRWVVTMVLAVVVPLVYHTTVVPLAMIALLAIEGIYVGIAVQASMRFRRISDTILTIAIALFILVFIQNIV